MTEILSNSHFVGVRAALAKKRKVNRLLNLGRRQAARAADAAGMLAADLQAPESPPLVFHLTYEDSKGDLSERIVTLINVSPRAEGDLFINAYCHLRNAPRKFIASRIEEVFDASTGEIHRDPVAFFQDHPMMLGSRDPEAAALHACTDEINLLTIVGMSDGDFDEDEQGFLLIHIFDRCPELALDEQLLRQRLELYLPDERAFRTSLSNVASGRSGDRKLLQRSLRKIVDADGRLHPSEVAFVMEINERLDS
jgi:hypothetical protein